MSQPPTRIAVITGASRGIGAAAAHALARQGRHVVLIARGRDQLDAVQQSIRQEGGLASICVCDVGDHAALAAAIDAVAEEHKRLDILVNNAGMTFDNLLLRMTDEQFDQVIHINLRSSFVACRAALRPMMRGRWGRIINIASVSGLMGNAGQSNYAAAKAGLVGFTKSIAREMASKCITANVVAPGFIQTEMTNHLSESIKNGAVKATPLGRFGQPHEIAGAIAYLTSEDAGFTTGQVLTVDGGMTMM